MIDRGVYDRSGVVVALVCSNSTPRCSMPDEALAKSVARADNTTGSSQPDDHMREKVQGLGSGDDSSTELLSQARIMVLSDGKR